MYEEMTSFYQANQKRAAYVYDTIEVLATYNNINFLPLKNGSIRFEAIVTDNKSTRYRIARVANVVDRPEEVAIAIKQRNSLSRTFFCSIKRFRSYRGSRLPSFGFFIAYKRIPLVAVRALKRHLRLCWKWVYTLANPASFTISSFFLSPLRKSVSIIHGAYVASITREKYNSASV